MSRVVIHIGMHKTGTTAVQNQFFAHQAALAEQGVVYPDIGVAAGHHSLIAGWVSLPAIYHQQRDTPEVALKSLTKTHGETDTTVFLSSEEFSRGYPRSRRVHFHELRDWLAGFERVEILCVLRDQVSFIQSVYQEMSRHAPPPAWPEFLQSALQSAQVDGLFLDFNDLYDYLLETFAAGEIRFVDYAQVRRQSGGVPREILKRLGVCLPPKALIPDTVAKSNISPEPLASWAGNILMGGRAPSPRMMDILRQALQDEFGDGCRTTIYTRQERENVRTHFAASNARFQRRVQQVQPGFCLTAIDLAECVPRGAITTEFWVRVARKIQAASGI